MGEPRERRGADGGPAVGAPLRPEERRVRTESEGRWGLRVTSYLLGGVWFASVDNVDPGATLSRSSGPTREAAEDAALGKARYLVSKTRTL